MARKKVSRQRAWQLRRQKRGLCTRCGHELLLTKNHCENCAKIIREAARARTNAKTRYLGAKSYQSLTEGRSGTSATTRRTCSPRAAEARSRRVDSARNDRPLYSCDRTLKLYNSKPETRSDKLATCRK